MDPQRALPDDDSDDGLLVLDEGRREQLGQLGRALRLSLVREPGASEDAPLSPPEGSGEIDPAELPAALDLVHRAAATMRATEKRAREIEAHAEALAQRAQQELKAAEARVQWAESRARAAEARVEEAEARAQAAEARFKRLCDAVEESFWS